MKKPGLRTGLGLVDEDEEMSLMSADKCGASILAPLDLSHFVQVKGVHPIMPQTVITLYTRNGCHLCEHTKQDLKELKNDYQFILEEIDIDKSDELTERYGLMIPVVHVNGKEAAFGKIHKNDISNRLHKIVKS